MKNGYNESIDGEVYNEFKNGHKYSSRAIYSIKNKFLLQFFWTITQLDYVTHDYQNTYVGN